MIYLKSYKLFESAITDQLANAGKLLLPFEKLYNNRLIYTICLLKK